MSAHDNGGPAFPVSTGNPDAPHQDGHTTAQFPGMTLRDYFAGKELAKVDCVSVCGEQHEYDRLAKHCYRMADAMLKARSE